MIATHHASGHPKMAEKTIAGAARMVPHDMPRESRKRNAVSDRVFASKRRSRNSYAVNTFAPWRKGTMVTPRITIAIGNPK